MVYSRSKGWPQKDYMNTETIGATTRDGVAATTEDGDGVGKDCATGGASTDDVNASFCDNTFIT